KSLNFKYALVVICFAMRGGANEEDSKYFIIVVDTVTPYDSGSRRGYCFGTSGAFGG
ncbi:unnamed protein product, partial [marine sediment metagenome]